MESRLPGDVRRRSSKCRARIQRGRHSDRNWKNHGVGWRRLLRIAGDCRHHHRRRVNPRCQDWLHRCISRHAAHWDRQRPSPVCRPTGDRRSPHQERHRQRGDQHQSPCRLAYRHIAHAEQAQTRAHHQREQHGSHRRFDHRRRHPLPPSCFFAAATRFDNRSSSARLTTFESSRPTSNSSTDPWQNQSTMRCTARAATFCGDSAGR